MENKVIENQIINTLKNTFLTLKECKSIHLENINLSKEIFDSSYIERINRYFYEQNQIILPKDEQITLDFGLKTGFYWHTADYQFQGVLNLANVDNVFSMTANKVPVYHRDFEEDYLKIMDNAYYFDTFGDNIGWDNATLFYRTQEMPYPELYFLDRFEVYPLHLSISDYIYYACACKGIVFWQLFFAPPQIVQKHKMELMKLLDFLKTNFPNEDYSFLENKLM